MSQVNPRFITLTIAERNAKIVEMRHSGAPVKTIAGTFGMTMPQVHHVLRRARALETSQTQRWIEGMTS